MRRIRYQVATSLDGYIAGPNGEADWIVMDPDIDFQAHFAQFDTVLLGRRSFEVISGGKKNAGGWPGDPQPRRPGGPARRRPRPMRRPVGDRPGHWGAYEVRARDFVELKNGL